MILDAHVHFWDPAHRHHEWLAEHPPLQRRYDPRTSTWTPRARWARSSCRPTAATMKHRRGALDRRPAAEHPVIRGIVAYAPLQLGRDARADLEAVAAEPLVVGIRRLLQAESPGLLRPPELVDGIRLLRRSAAVRHLRHARPASAVADVIAACRRCRSSSTTSASRPSRPAALDPWRDDLARIAAHPTSRASSRGSRPKPIPAGIRAASRPYLEHALDASGRGAASWAATGPSITLTATVSAGSTS